MQMPIPDDWDGTSFCRWAVCWPDSIKWKAILYGLIEQPSQGRYWDADTGSITGTQASFRPAYDKNFELARVIMACDDTGLLAIADAIRALALTQQQAINISAGCGCGGSAGQGEIAPPYNPTEQGDPETAPPPEGFETWEEFFANKCAVATDIVTTLRADVQRMTTINLIGLTLGSIVPILLGLLLTPIPGDEVAVVGGLLLATLALGAGMLDAIGDIIDDNFDDLVCALYEGTSAAAAESAFESAFSDAWDASGFNGAPYEFSGKSLVNFMVGSASVNRLFTLDTGRTLPAGDCTSCEEELGPCFLFPSSVEGWEDIDAWSSTPGTLTWIAPGNMQYNHPGDPAGSGSYIQGPIMNYVVQAGDELTVSRHVSSPAISLQVILVIGGSDNIVSTANWITGCSVDSLAGYVGQTVDRIKLRVTRGATTAFTVNFGSIGFQCPDC